MWGYHLRLDAAGCNDNIKDQLQIGTFCSALVKTIEMKAFGEPQIVRFGDDPKLTGFTLIQLIETSNISAHFCDHTGEAYVDIFSCQKFDPELAIKCFEQYFAPNAMHSDFKTRQAPVISPS